MTTLEENYNKKKKNCMVHNCNNTGEYKNPDSGMVYCFNCAENLGFKIIYQSYSRKGDIIQKEISTRLTKIPTPDFDIMDMGD